MSRRSKRKRQGKPQPAEKPSSPPDRPLLPPSATGESTSKLVISHQQRQLTGSFSGPIPPPQVLREYDEILPGLAGRIVAQAERQTEHRISLESKVIESDISRSRQGPICGLIVALACVGGGIITVLYGHDWAGTTIATAAVVALAGVFVYGTAMRRSERTDKAKIMTGQE